MISTRAAGFAAMLAVLAGWLSPCSTVLAGGDHLSVSAAPPPVIPTDRIIVKFRDRTISRAAKLEHSQLATLSARAGIGLSHVRVMSGDAQVLRLPRRMSPTEVEVITRRLAADPQIEYAEPDRIMRPLLFPDDPQYGNQWHYHASVAQPPYAAVAGGANLPGAWDIITGSAGIVVAVVDSGLAAHADIDGDILDGSGRVLPGYDFISPDSPGIFYTANDGDGRDANPADAGDWITTAESAGTDPVSGTFFLGCPVSNSSWHGTHLAGTIGALGNNGSGVAGINWVSKILPVRVLGKCGGYSSDILDGIRWAAGLTVSGVPSNSNPARVLNLSFGGEGACSAAWQSAINAVVAAGAVVVAAAGNESVDLGTTPVTPAVCNNVISVAAVTRYGGRANYSNYGTMVAIAAPGGAQSYANDPNGILSTLNTGTTTPVASPNGDSFRYYQGTSMAAPHVAGVASLMLSARSSLTPAQLLAALQGSARAFPTGTGSDCSVTTCGAGIIDAQAAVTAVALGVLAPSPASLSFGAASVGQVTIAQTATFTNTGFSSVTLNASNAVTVTGSNAADFAVTGGSCGDGVVVNPGQGCTVTASFTPTAVGTRSASLVISSSAGNSPVSVALSGVGTPPTVTVSATDAAASEAGPDPGSFTLTRTGATTAPLVVNFTLAGTATHGADYTAVGASAVIAAGSATTTVAIMPIDDATYEGSETVVMTLGASASYLTGSPASATVTIADDDPRPPVGGAAGIGGGGCFIATAAYGTPMASEVRYLRAFRDQYLLNSRAGQWLVQQYYRYSPTLADSLRQHDGWRAVVRAGLAPLVKFSQWLVSDESVVRQTADRP